MRNILLVALCAVAAAPALAKDVEVNSASCGASCQAEFDSVATDLVAAIDYKALGPAEATGIVGFGIGVVGSYVPVDASASWQKVTGQDFSGLGLVGLQVTKGLPLNIDVGAFYTAIPGTNVKVAGGEARYAFLPGSTVAPAVALRGSYVKVMGIDSFSLDSKTVDLSLSKGLGPITPYVGVGYIWGSADPDAATQASTGLSEAKVEDAKAYIGARFSLGLIEFTPEIATIASVITYSARFGFSISL
jgi:hypothetical protein